MMSIDATTSASGQSLPNSDVRVASVHPSISDMMLHRRERREGPVSDSCAATKSRQFRNWLSGMQLIQQRLRLLQIERVEAFGEPAVDRSEQFTSLLPFPLITPQPRRARRRAQFPGLRLLLPRDRKRALEIDLRFRCIRLARRHGDLAGDAVGLGLEPSFLACFDRGHCFVDAAPSIVKLS